MAGKLTVAVVSFGHVDVTLPLVRELSKHPELSLTAYLCFALNRKSESVLNFEHVPIRCGFQEPDKMTQIIPREISNYLGISPSPKIFAFRNLKLRSARNVLLSLEFVKELKNYDIVHFNGINGVLPLLVYLLRMKRLVFTIHDIRPHSGEQTRFKLMERFVKRICASSRSVIIMNRSDYHYCRSKFGESNSKFELIPFGTLDICKEFKSKTRIASDILFFGRISPYKGLPYLIEAARILRDRGESYSIIIAGAGRLEYAQQMLSQLNITLINRYIPNGELTGLMEGTRIVVCPYTDSTQSGVVMTAFAFNKPVVATSVGGFGDVVVNDFNGITVEPKNATALADAISALLSDPVRLARLGRNIESFKTESQHRWETVAAKTLEVYKRAL